MNTFFILANLLLWGLLFIHAPTWFSIPFACLVTFAYIQIVK